MIKFNSIKISILSSVFFLGVFSVALWYQSSALMDIETGGAFEEALPMVDVENLVDIGVVDFNGDNYIDVFTTNHNQKQLLLENSGDGSFVDVLSEVGLSQSAMFPGIELARRSPDSEEPGFYIFWKNTELILKWNPRLGIDLPSGRIVLSSLVQVTHHLGFDVNIAKNEGGAGSVVTVIEFVGKSQGEMRIVPEYIAIPVSINMSADFPLGDIYVGQNKVNPYGHEFEFNLADRHGMAWADYDRDGELDVYITRGGLKGDMGKFTEEFSDELYKSSESGFVNVINKSGIIKQTCPGYQVQWVDYDNDNALDIYISCQRGNENQLFKNNGSGVFSEVAAEQGVNVANNSFHAPFLWIDVDMDDDADLLINDGDQYKLLINTESGFKSGRKSFQLPNVVKMTVADYDHDGDLDVFAVSTSGRSSLLKNVEGEFEQLQASTLGLPDKALTANWVDYDNDGFIDLHVIPGGIYRQNSKHKFEETGVLSHKLSGSIFKTRANWVDLDNDGDRDLIMAIYYKKPLWEQLYDRVMGQYTPLWGREYQPWNVRTFINNEQDNGNYWLQLDLAGHSGNKQAIGARVALHLNDNRIISHVGQSEGSHMSQGHFRLYFGLGSVDVVSSIVISWPDGHDQVYKSPMLNRVLKIERD